MVQSTGNIQGFSMNETEIILMNIFAFGFGWFIGYLVRNIGFIWSRWGAILGFFFLYVAFFVTLSLAGVIASEENVIVSALFGFGFLVRFFKQRLEIE